MTIITISRQFGSGGDEIVDKVCQITGYYPFGKLQIAQAALDAGLTDVNVVDYSEDNYKVKNFVERLFKRPTRLGQIHVWKEDTHGVRSIETVEVTEDTALILVEKAVKAAYKADNMVIVGRGGQVILSGLANVLHVRIEALMEDRIQRIKAHLKEERQAYDGTIDIRREAQDIIRSHDEASAEYIKQYYHLDWADPSLYHLIINTSQVSMDKAASTIVEKAKNLHLVAEH